MLRPMKDEIGIRPSKTCPKFLASNATSHVWAFSAIAELIDNAYDPDVRANHLNIGFERYGDDECLTFTDDGAGMTHDKLYKMLSFGYSEKEEVDGIVPIGKYGNGFKSGSMRLGKDALVITGRDGTFSVGLLSQTYLEAIAAETVLIPIVTFKATKPLRPGEFDSFKMQPDNAKTADALKTILEWSIIKTKDQLFDEFQRLLSSENAKSGTKIIIWHLTDDIGFVQRADDIVNTKALDHDPEHFRSLRKYCSILYLRPKMMILIRHQKVKSRYITKQLARTEVDTYKPKDASNLTIPIHFGFLPKKFDPTQESYGMMMYHRNRLIKAYERVGYQREANEKGVGVIGVVEINCLNPIHNKQDFERTDAYLRLMKALERKLNEYWDEKTMPPPGRSQPPPESVKPLAPDSSWVRCDACLQWRRLPQLPNGAESVADLEDQNWYCYMNPDSNFNTCDIPEEGLEEGEVDVASRQAPYKKTVKRQQESAKKARRQEQEMVLIRRQRELEEKEAELSQREMSLMERELSLTPGNLTPATNITQGSTPRGPVGRPAVDLMLPLEEQQQVEVDSPAKIPVRHKRIEKNKRITADLLDELLETAKNLTQNVINDGSNENSQEEISVEKSVQCRNCKEWRQLPANIQNVDVRNWHCSEHPDASIFCPSQTTRTKRSRKNETKADEAAKKRIKMEDSLPLENSTSSNAGEFSQSSINSSPETQTQSRTNKDDDDNHDGPMMNDTNFNEARNAKRPTNAIRPTKFNQPMNTSGPTNASRSKNFNGPTKINGPLNDDDGPIVLDRNRNDSDENRSELDENRSEPIPSDDSDVIILDSTDEESDTSDLTEEEAAQRRQFLRLRQQLHRANQLLLKLKFQANVKMEKCHQAIQTEPQNEFSSPQQRGVANAGVPANISQEYNELKRDVAQLIEFLLPGIRVNPERDDLPRRIRRIMQVNMSSQPPTNRSQTPANPSQPLLNRSQTPTNSSQPPMNRSQTPANQSQPPMNRSQPSTTNRSQTPANHSQSSLNSSNLSSSSGLFLENRNRKC